VRVFESACPFYNWQVSALTDEGGYMALTLSSTDKELEALIKTVYADEKVEAHEHMKLRRISDEVLERLRKLDSLSTDLQNIARHADGFVEACTSLAKNVHRQYRPAEAHQGAAVGEPGSQWSITG
jgi:hypothetical protein